MSLYQRFRGHWKKPEFWIMIGFAAVIIGLSFGQTKEFAAKVGATNFFHQLAFAIAIEVLFAYTLLTRANQRAQRKNVPLFLNVAYVGLLGAITIINMSVLYEAHKIAGPFLGILITGTMLYVENLFVWYATESDQPAKKAPKQLLREAKKEIKEEEILQLIEYMKYEARKPSLSLIKRARRDEKKRKRIETGQSFWPWSKSEEGLPEYFRKEKPNLEEVIAEELRKTEPQTVEVDPEPEVEPEQGTGQLVVPFRRPIGFHVEYDMTAESNTKTSPNSENSPNSSTIGNTMVQGVRSNTKMTVRPNKSNTKKTNSSKSKSNTKTMTKKEQAIQLVLEMIERNAKYSVSLIADEIGCARSTAHSAIKIAEMIKKR